jgi:hypothetical protein
LNFLKTITDLVTGSLDAAPAELPADPVEMTAIVRPGGSDAASWSARDKESINRIREVAALSPLVDVLLDSDDCVVASMPWSWVKIIISPPDNSSSSDNPVNCKHSM